MFGLTTFLHDACANGQRIKCPAIIDAYTRALLAIDVAGNIRSKRVRRQRPRVCFQGPLRGVADQGHEVVLIKPGNPGKTAWSKASMAHSGMPACPWNGFVPAWKPRWSLKRDGEAAMPSDRFRVRQI